MSECPSVTWMAIQAAAITVPFVFALLGAHAFLVTRIHKVFDYRKVLIERIGPASIKEAYEGHDPSWRWREFEVVSYDAMVWKFWRRVDSFYPAPPDRPRAEPEPEARPA